MWLLTLANSGKTDGRERDGKFCYKPAATKKTGLFCVYMPHPLNYSHNHAVKKAYNLLVSLPVLIAPPVPIVDKNVESSLCL